MTIGRKCLCTLGIYQLHIILNNLILFFSVETIEPTVSLGGLSNHSSSSSPENSDDFVLVPNNLPIDQVIVNYERK